MLGAERLNPRARSLLRYTSCTSLGAHHDGGGGYEILAEWHFPIDLPLCSLKNAEPLVWMQQHQSQPSVV